MSMSAGQFAREFEKLKSVYSEYDSSDMKIILLLDFWPNLAEQTSQKTYNVYFEEYYYLLNAIVERESLQDMTIENLKSLKDIYEVFDDLAVTQDDDHVKLDIILRCLAEIYFYVGDFKQGIEFCVQIVKEKFALPTDINQFDGLNEFDAFRNLYDYYKDKNPKLAGLLKEIYDDWQGIREGVYNDRINCLFVEKDDHGRSLRGRLAVLEGSVETGKKSAKSDQISFDNQIKTPDDPFIGCGYDSLSAIRRKMGQDRIKSASGRYYTAHLNIKNSKQTFSGDSIGLSIGLLSYIGLIKEELRHEKKLISSSAAFTGTLDESGRLLAVNDETIAIKIERAFFSPLQYVSLPEANLTTAKKHLNILKSQYPNRRLIPLGAETLSEVICNRNIIIGEKVCPYAYTKDVVKKYGRMIQVQIPLAILFAMLIYILVGQWYHIFPAQNPEYVKLTETGFDVLNRDSIPLWSVNYGCDFLTEADYDFLSMSLLYDIDNDSLNEVLIIPKVDEATICEKNAVLHVYDDDGILLFRKNCVIPNEFPDDIHINQPYRPFTLEILQYNDRKLIYTGVCKSMHARSYLRFFTLDGKDLGWYINNGHCGMKSDNVLFYSENELLLNGYNNRVEKACLLILDPYSCYGISPPYRGFLKDVRRGNQISYILFPRTDVNTGEKYSSPNQVAHESSDQIRVKISEKGDLKANLWYYVNDDFRVTSVGETDEFRRIRDSLVQAGTLEPVDKNAYLSDLRDSVMYFIDSSWITERELRALENK